MVTRPPFGSRDTTTHVETFRYRLIGPKQRGSLVPEWTRIGSRFYYARCFCGSVPGRRVNQWVSALDTRVFVQYVCVCVCSCLLVIAGMPVRLLVAKRKPVVCYRCPATRLLGSFGQQRDNPS